MDSGEGLFSLLFSTIVLFLCESWFFELNVFAEEWFWAFGLLGRCWSFPPFWLDTSENLSTLKQESVLPVFWCSIDCWSESLLPLIKDANVAVEDPRDKRTRSMFVSWYFSHNACSHRPESTTAFLLEATPTPLKDDLWWNRHLSVELTTDWGAVPPWSLPMSV